ncbi:MAG: hypothetical protein IKV56_04075 [Kiritimatiellae bacterium]|nr:hypothetical protein [Kiritimatiellia bacterium]
MEKVDPDMFLAKPASIKLGKGLLISLVVHLILIAFTSIGLYKAWAKWGISSDKGFHTPNVIKALEKEERKAAEAEAQKKAEAEAKKPEVASEKKEASTPEKKAPEKPQELPFEKEVEKPPKSFDLGDIDL